MISTLRSSLACSYTICSEPSISISSLTSHLLPRSLYTLLQQQDIRQRSNAPRSRRNSSRHLAHSIKIDIPYDTTSWELVHPNIDYHGTRAHHLSSHHVYVTH